MAADDKKPDGKYEYDPDNLVTDLENSFGIEINAPENQEDAYKDQDHNDIAQKLRIAELESQAESKANQKVDDRTLRNAVIASGGVGGAYLRHKGVEIGNILKPGATTYQASPQSVVKINTVLRQKTGDPRADIRQMTDEAVDRILSGGEGPTYGTSGRQRTEGFNLETSRRARHQKEIESLVESKFPGTRDPYVSVGESMVPLKSNIVVPESTARQMAEQKTQQNLQAIQEAERKAARSGLASGAAKVGMGALGGALTAAQGLNMATQKEPIDWTQWLSLGGGPLMTFGGKLLGPIGALMQMPYAVKHPEEYLPPYLYHAPLNANEKEELERRRNIAPTPIANKP